MNDDLISRSARLADLRESGKKVLTVAEYIKREDAIKLIFKQFHMYFEVPCLPRDEAIQRQVCAVRDKINEIPAADVAPVRHGHWIMKKTSAGASYTVCSHCNASVKYNDEYGTVVMNLKGANYCPNYGAKMEGGAD